MKEKKKDQYLDFIEIVLKNRLLRKWKHKLHTRRKYFQNTHYAFDKEVTSKIHKEHLKFNSKSKSMTQLKCGLKFWTDFLPNRMHRSEIITWKDSPHPTSLGNFKLRQ
jgi:hypothetical protein